MAGFDMFGGRTGHWTSGSPEMQQKYQQAMAQGRQNLGMFDQSIGQPGRTETFSTPGMEQRYRDQMSRGADMRQMMNQYLGSRQGPPMATRFSSYSGDPGIWQKWLQQKGYASQAPQAPAGTSSPMAATPSYGDYMKTYSQPKPYNILGMKG